MMDDLPPIKPITLHYKIGTTAQRKTGQQAPTFTVLGEDTQTGAQITTDDVSRCSGCYVIGTQGVGKSSLLESMIYQDIEKGYSVIVLDPHGQLIENIVSRMPQKHLNRVYLLDLTDEDYPFGFNIFSPSRSSREPTITINRVMSIFEKVWPSETRGLLLPMLLQNVTETLIEHADSMTVADIPALLLDGAFRAEKIARLKNPRLKEYWQLEYDTNSPSVQRRETAPLRTRLNSWLSDSVITNIICQKEATIDFRAAIDNREIILVKLPISQPGYEHAAPIIGTMILSQIYAATFSFADTPEHRRSGYSLYIDEFQKFASPDTARLFTEGRKYKVRQTLAHQTRVQLKLPEVKSATMSANTTVSFRLEPDDAPDLARKFTDIDLYPEIENIDRAFMGKLRSHKNEAVKTLWAHYVRYWQEADNKEPKRRREDGYTYSEWPRWNLGFGLVEYHPNQVRAALSILDELLYHTMRHKEKELDSNLSQSLMNIVVNWYDEEQQQQFIRHLSAAIEALMLEPIGEKRKTDKAEIENYLINVDNRYALIKCAGQPTHAIKTLPLISGVSPAETQRRIERIKEHTRNKYCRSKDEIEAELGNIDTFDAEERPAQSDTLQKLASSDPTLVTFKIRYDIEQLIKALHKKSVPTSANPANAKPTRTNLSILVKDLRKYDILDNSLTNTLLKIISTANPVIHGEATIESEQAISLVNSSLEATDALTRILQSHTDKSKWARFEPLE